MFELDGARAEELLGALGEILEQSGAGPFDILACGGMTMILRGLTERLTRDIDAVGLVREVDGALEVKKPTVEQAFLDARRRVASVFGVPETWLSFQARTLLEDGLPEKMAERAEIREYGSMLRIRWASRGDLVALKMWAAASDPARRVDLRDLIEMEVSEEEAEIGLHYCLGKGADPAALAAILERMGRGRLASRLD